MPAPPPPGAVTDDAPALAGAAPVGAEPVEAAAVEAAAVESAPAEVVPAGRALDRTKLLAARYKAAMLRPYLATALYALSVVPSRHLATMGVDRRWRLYVSPEFVAGHSVEELAGVWVHEVAHLLRDHHGRADRLAHADRDDHHRVNLAQDLSLIHI